MAQINDIEGIGDVYARALQSAGVSTTDQLLEIAKTPAGRKELASRTDIRAELILKWTNRADLSRISGIGSEYADLLEAAGVDTVPELAQRNPENLHAKILEVNEAKKLVRRTPAASQVSDWVEQAGSLPRVIVY